MYMYVDTDIHINNEGCIHAIFIFMLAMIAMYTHVHIDVPIHIDIALHLILSLL